MLTACAVVLAMARPLPARAVEDPNEIRRQIVVVEGRLNRLATLLMAFSVEDPNIRAEQAAALMDIRLAEAVLFRLYEDPNLRTRQEAAAAAIDVALGATERLIEDPNLRRTPGIGEIRGAWAAASAAAATLFRMIEDPNE
jgi:HEAT repeat protein